MKRNIIIITIAAVLALSVTPWAGAGCTSMVLAGGQSYKQATDIDIRDWPVEHTEVRRQLIREYALEHYGLDMLEIVPRAVVVHWTVFKTAEATHDYFYGETDDEDTLNVCSQFLVDRDGTIYRLAKETLLCRHAIGYNWCAIGIENVGGFDGKEDLTPEQLRANIALIRYLHAKYPTIDWVFGHYQQNEAKVSGLYKENVKDYYAEKIDPGPKFMNALADHLRADGLNFVSR